MSGGKMFGGFVRGNVRRLSRIVITFWIIGTSPLNIRAAKF